MMPETLIAEKGPPLAAEIRQSPHDRSILKIISLQYEVMRQAHQRAIFWYKKVGPKATSRSEEAHYDALAESHERCMKFHAYCRDIHTYWADASRCDMVSYSRLERRWMPLALPYQRILSLHARIVISWANQVFLYRELVRSCECLSAAPAPLVACHAWLVHSLESLEAAHRYIVAAHERLAETCQFFDISEKRRAKMSMGIVSSWRRLEHCRQCLTGQRRRPVSLGVPLADVYSPLANPCLPFIDLFRHGTNLFQALAGNYTYLEYVGRILRGDAEALVTEHENRLDSFELILIRYLRLLQGIEPPLLPPPFTHPRHSVRTPWPRLHLPHGISQLVLRHYDSIIEELRK